MSLHHVFWDFTFPFSLHLKRFFCLPLVYFKCIIFLFHGIFSLCSYFDIKVFLVNFSISCRLNEIILNDTVVLCYTLSLLTSNEFVYVKTTKSFFYFQAPGKGKLPVFVWIHGGAFQAGQCNLVNCGPHYLMDHGIVVVTLHYRVGPFGKIFYYLGSFWWMFINIYSKKLCIWSLLINEEITLQTLYYIFYNYTYYCIKCQT